MEEARDFVNRWNGKEGLDLKTNLWKVVSTELGCYVV